MVLRGWLSNRDLAASLNSLTVALQNQPRWSGRETAGGFAYAENRRRFGTVGGAVGRVLAEAAEPAKLETIHRAVERELGGSVSLYSVYGHLLNHLRGPEALFERPRHGYYALRAVRITGPPPEFERHCHKRWMPSDGRKC